MKKIDPHRTDLALEFKANPYGPHSDELQKYLNVMRWQPKAGKYVLISTDAGDAWCLGRLPAKRGQRVEIFEDVCFQNHAQGLWHLFKCRWKYQTGQELELD